MRLLLLPISTRQSLLYCHKITTASSPSSASLSAIITSPSTWADRITTKASETWNTWEHKPSGWQKKVTESGNRLLKRLPFEEWGLKSVPPLTAKRKQHILELLGKTQGDGRDRRKEELVGKGIVNVEFPEGYVQPERAEETVKGLGGDEKQRFHTKWLLGSIVGMPLTAPLALIPILPNLPFFYLCFRAWSHWRARAGSQHLEFLLQNQLTKITPSPILRMAYTEAILDTKMKWLEEDLERTRNHQDERAASERDEEERLILHKTSGKAIAETLEIPALETEIDRAVWQVERQIRSRKDSNEEKREMESKEKQQ